MGQAFIDCFLKLDLVRLWPFEHVQRRVYKAIHFIQGPQAFHTYGFHRHSQHVPLQAHRLLAWNASLFLPAEFRRKCPPPTRLWRVSTAFQPWPICLGFPTHSKSIYLGFPTHFHPKGHSLPSHALAQGIQSWTWPSPSTWGAQLFALKVCSAWCKFLGSPYWVLPCLCLCFHPCFHISPTTGCLWHGKQHQDQWCAKCPSWLPKGWPPLTPKILWPPNDSHSSAGVSSLPLQAAALLKSFQGLLPWLHLHHAQGCSWFGLGRPNSL